MEEWKNIPGFEDRYQVSTLGRIKALPKVVHSGKNKYIKWDYPESIMKPLENDRGGGYHQVYLYSFPLKRQRFYVHRIVALTFLPNPNNYPFVNHKDGDGRNNKVENLEWCTSAMNRSHAIDKLGKYCGGSKILVLNTATGIFYDSLTDAHRSCGGKFSYIYFTQMITDSANHKNKTDFIAA